MDHKRLQREIEEAERELDAAKRLSDVRAAAARLQRAKAALQGLDDEEKPKAGPTAASARKGIER